MKEYDLSVVYRRGGIQPLLDQAIERAAGRRSTGSGILIQGMVRDLSFSFPSAAARRAAMKRILALDPELEVR